MTGQQYKAKRFTGTTAERNEIMVGVAHLLNRLRGVAEELDDPQFGFSGKEEGLFWQFISLLPKDAQSSVIN